jgi:hypothetical protein
MIERLRKSRQILTCVAKCRAPARRESFGNDSKPHPGGTTTTTGSDLIQGSPELDRPNNLPPVCSGIRGGTAAHTKDFP